MDENHTCRRTMIDDSKMREQLTKLIGLDEVPEIDPNAIDKFDGLFDDLVDGPTDCVQLLKEMRIRDFYKTYHTSEEEVTEKPDCFCNPMAGTTGCNCGMVFECYECWYDDYWYESHDEDGYPI